jgi:hypothetical protein
MSGNGLTLPPILASMGALMSIRGATDTGRPGKEPSMAEGRVPDHGEQISPELEYCSNCDDFVGIGHTKHCFGWVDADGEPRSSGQGDVPETDDEMYAAIEGNE